MNKPWRKIEQQIRLNLCRCEEKEDLTLGVADLILVEI